MRKHLNECGNISRDDLEDAIAAYFDHIDQYGEDNVPMSEADLAAFVADELGVSADDLDCFAPIFGAAVAFDEDGYINACDKAFFKSELQDNFHDFWKAKKARMNESAMNAKELMLDPQLRKYRRISVYVNGDLKTKYSMLWKYLIREMNTNIAGEDELSDICMEIAMHDENTI